MTVSLKEVDELVRELSVTIPADKVNEQMEQKFVEVQKDAELKGYRKGKAPIDMIRTIYGERIKADVAEELVNISLSEAMAQHKLRIATRPNLQTASFENGGFQYVATVELFPEIGTISLDGLTYPNIEVEATDQEVNEMVDTIRRRGADIRTVTRPATQSDMIVADLHKTSDPDNVLKTDAFPDTTIDLESPMTVKEFKEQLVGVKAGDEKNVDVTYDNTGDSALTGHKIGYRIVVKEVKERILPNLDDGFAKQTGLAETALELKLKVRENILAHKKEDLKKKQKNELARQLVTSNAFPVPPSYLNGYLNAVIEDIKQQQGTVNEAELRDSYKEIALNTLRWEMLFHHIAEQEKIEVLPSDTEKVIQGFAERYQVTRDEAAQALAKSGKVDSIKDSILEGKVFDLIFSKARPTSAA